MVFKKYILHSVLVLFFLQITCLIGAMDINTPLLPDQKTTLSRTESVSLGIAVINKRIHSLASSLNPQEQADILKIIFLRSKVMHQLSHESCVYYSMVDFDRSKRALEYREFEQKTLELFDMAEILYTESSDDVRKVIDLLDLVATKKIESFGIGSLESCHKESKEIMILRQMLRFYEKNSDDFSAVQKSRKYREINATEIKKVNSYKAFFIKNGMYKSVLKSFYEEIMRNFGFQSLVLAIPKLDISYILPKKIFCIDDFISFSNGESADKITRNLVWKQLYTFLKLVRCCEAKDAFLSGNTKPLSKKNRDALSTLTLLIDDKRHPFCLETLIKIAIPKLFGFWGESFSQELENIIQPTQVFRFLTTIDMYHDFLGSRLYIDEGNDANRLVNLTIRCKNTDFFSSLISKYNFELFPQKELPKQAKKKRTKKSGKKTYPQKITSTSSSNDLSSSDPEISAESSSSSSSESHQSSPDVIASDDSCDSSEKEELLKQQESPIREEEEEEPIIKGCSDIQNVLPSVFLQDEIFYQDDKICCFFDVERANKGGQQNRLFIFPPNTLLGFNPLKKLSYSQSVVSKKFNDNNHTFSSLIEKEGGKWATLRSHTKITNIDPEYQNGYRERFEYVIPGILASFGYPLDHAQKKGASGFFEFVILKKHTDKSGGLCVHRFFRPN